jgi:hypothetical protein
MYQLHHQLDAKLVVVGRLFVRVRVQDFAFIFQGLWDVFLSDDQECGN